MPAATTEPEPEPEPEPATTDAATTDAASTAAATTAEPTTTEATIEETETAGPSPEDCPCSGGVCYPWGDRPGFCTVDDMNTAACQAWCTPERRDTSAGLDFGYWGGV